MAGLGSLTAGLVNKTVGRQANAMILELNDQGLYTNQAYAFQYWPDTIRDSKEVNWSEKEIPGGSLPVYSWISSGKREISFTAQFTCDNDIASDSAVTKNLYKRLKASGEIRNNIDIRSAISWLRRFMLPSYGTSSGVTNTPIVFPPRRLLLVMPGLALNVSGGDCAVTANRDILQCLMTQCEVTYVQSFPSGIPRIVEVSLAFVQSPQREGGAVIFPQYAISDGSMDAAVQGGNAFFYGYALKGAG